jgi:HD-like signal output (HDOD) protein
MENLNAKNTVLLIDDEQVILEVGTLMLEKLGCKVLQAQNGVEASRTNHAEIGALIIDKWSFPPEIVIAVCWHHDPDHISRAQNRLNEPTMQSDIVYLSNLIFESIADSESVGEKFVMPSPGVLKRLGIKLDQYQVIAEKAHSWKNELSETLPFE